MNWYRYPVSLVIAFVLVLIPSGFAQAQAGAGITIGDISGVSTEAGAKPTFTVVLDTQPSANVTIGLVSSDPAEGTVAPASVTFTKTNWNTERTVTVTGVNDPIDDGDFTYAIITTPAVSTDPNYNGLNPDDVTVINEDNDTAGFTVSAISGNTTEAGAVATFKVRANSRPERNVNLGLSSSDLTEGTVSPALLVFTPGNWATLQTVSVRGVDDTIADPNMSYSIVIAAAISGDELYSGVDPADITVTNVNNDAADFIISPSTPLTTSENGAAAAFTIVASSRPSADVTIGLSSSDETEGTVSPSSVTFTSANWNTPQRVTVRGQNDSVMDGNVQYQIVTAPSVSTDAAFNNVNPANVVVTNTDNDVASVAISPLTGAVTELGGKATFMVKLTSKPSHDVTIGLSSSDDSEASVAPASLVFTDQNWNTPRTVTVTGLDDALVDGNKSFDIVTAAAVSDDDNYDGNNAANVTTTNRDNEGIRFSDGTYRSNESAGSAVIEVELTGSPEAGNPVTVHYATSNGSATAGSDYTASSGTLTFAAGEQSKTFEVPITNDLLVETDESIRLALSAATNGVIVNPGAATLIIPTNDSVGFNPTSYKVVEKAADILVTVKLNGPSTQQVTVDYATSDGTAVAGSDYEETSGTLTFAAGQTSKTIPVRILEDTASEEDQVFSVTLTDPTNATLSSQTVAQVTIATNDPITFRATAYNVHENVDEVSVVVQLSGGASTSQVRVDYATSDGSAVEGSDYQEMSGTLIFAAGQTSKTINIPITEDGSLETDETFLVTLSNPINGALSSVKVATVRILTNDSLKFSGPTYSVTENVAMTTITVKLNAASSDIVKVSYATSDGTATSGEDYTPSSGTLTFAPGETVKTFTVAIINDTTDEPNETVTLTLSSPVKAGIGAATATLTIGDND